MTRILAAAVFCAAVLVTAQAFGKDKCEASMPVELPITMKDFQPTIVAQINGRDGRFLVDSGAFFSIISRATAAEYNLKTTPTFGLRVQGVGGSQAAEVTKVKEFSLVGVPIKDIEFIVGGSEVGSNVVGVLGQNFLEVFDVEYDLGHGVIRLLKTKNCEHANLAYWLKENESYSQMAIETTSTLHPHTIGTAEINGQRIKIAFDSGASTSVLSAEAAARAGVKPDSQGVQEVGFSQGIGRGTIKTYIARFDSFKVGDGEEVKNAKLRFAKIDLPFADMLLGADFFMSHRIFVGNKEHKLYLTYNGGPVFDLSKHAEQPLSADNDTPAQEAAASDTLAPETAANPAARIGGSEGNAAELARRGSALIGRRDFAAGLPLLSQAIALSPNDPELYYQRANAYWQNDKPDLALADFDQVIKLKQDFLPAYVPRAELQLWKKNDAAALADLNTVDGLAPKQADLRFSLAVMYERIDHIKEAVEQYGLWIDSHPDDSRMVSALAGRCVGRALENQELPAAMKDCDKALWRADKKNIAYAQLWVDRAIVRIRIGEYDKAIGDCNDAVKMSPNNARALYVRAVAESKANKTSESATDLSAALKIAPKIGARLGRFGIAP